MGLTSREKAILSARAAVKKKAFDVVILEVIKITTIADYFLICSGDSRRQVRAVMDHIDRELSKVGITPLHIEGIETCRWVLVDYDDLIIHIFDNQTRLYYDLDRLWGDAPKVLFTEEATSRKS